MSAADGSAGVAVLAAGEALRLGPQDFSGDYPWAFLAGFAVMLGSFVIRSQGRALAAVLVGSILGIIVTAWTLVLPIVVLAVVILRILDAEPRSVTIPQRNS